jgi:hypothetical protein
MSQVKVSANVAGTGVFTIASPNSNTDRTLTLPDATDTLVGKATSDILTNKTLVDPSVTGALSLNGSNVSPVQSFRNKIINGNFDIWQRGTSTSTGGFLADRWRTVNSGSTFTSSRQSFTLGQTDVSNEPTYYHRTVVTSSAGSGNYCLLWQPIESVRTLAGQTATLSFWAKADASKNIAVEFFQNFGSGGSPSSSVFGISVTTCSLTTSWQKFTINVSFPSISGKTLGSNNDDYITLVLWFDAGTNFNSRTNSLGQQSGTFDIAQVQLEAGSVATPFEVRPPGVELALCQRYYGTVTTQVTAVASNPAKGVYFKVSMRAIPTVSGGGSGFTAVNQTVDGFDCVQTTAANQTLTLSAEL